MTATRSEESGRPPLAGSRRDRPWSVGPRALLVVLSAVLVVVVATVADLQPRPVPVLLVAAVVVGVGGLLLDALAVEPTAWDEPDRRPASGGGADARTTRLLHVLEAHLAARRPSPALRERLGTTAATRLRTRHGVEPGTAAARGLLGEDVADLLAGSGRLDRQQITRCLTRIEEL